MLTRLDLVVIFIYLFGILIFSAFIGRKLDLEGFLVNRRATKLAFLVFTVVSTNVGAGTIVAVCSAGYSSGIAYGLTFAIVVFIGFLIVALLASRIKKFGDKYKAHTFAEFFEKRYSKKTGILVAVLVLVSYFFWMALQFIAIGSLMKVATGWSWNLSLVLSGLIVILYTTLGGIKSDFYTDMIQFWIIFVVLFGILLPTVLTNIGGWSAFSQLPPTLFSPFSFGGHSFFFGMIATGTLLLIVSMEVWQRIYAAANVKTAKQAFVIAALINAPVFLVSALLGMGARILFKEIAPEYALFKLMFKYLPPGILGLGMAGTLAAFMSSVDSMIMVESATFLKDIYKKLIRPTASEDELLKAGRLFTFFFGLIGLVVALVYPRIVEVQLLGFFTLLCFVPAVIGGLIWKRGNAAAAFISCLTGFIVVFLLFFTRFQKQAFIPAILISTVLYIILSYILPDSDKNLPSISSNFSKP